MGRCENFLQGFFWGINIAAVQRTKNHAATTNCSFKCLHGHTVSNDFLQQKPSVLTDERSKHGFVSLHTIQILCPQSPRPRHEVQPSCRVCVAHLLVRKQRRIAANYPFNQFRANPEKGWSLELD